MKHVELKHLSTLLLKKLVYNEFASREWVELDTVLDDLATIAEDSMTSAFSAHGSPSEKS